MFQRSILNTTGSAVFVDRRVQVRQFAALLGRDQFLIDLGARLSIYLCACHRLWCCGSLRDRRARHIDVGGKRRGGDERATEHCNDRGEFDGFAEGNRVFHD